jgi:hypothetical protein
MAEGNKADPSDPEAVVRMPPQRFLRKQEQRGPPQDDRPVPSLDEVPVAKQGRRFGEGSKVTASGQDTRRDLEVLD